MPTYEYECQKCGHHFEQFQRITAERLKSCPKCRGKVKRLLGTGAGIIFKGSGFYQTDYRSKNYSEGARKESSESAVPKKEETKSSSSKETRKSSEKSK